MKPTDQLAATIAAVSRAPLAAIPRGQADRIRRRIVGGEPTAPRLDVAAFNSAT